MRAFEAAGVDGEITEGGVLLSVVNRGGNKLDWFLDVEATMSVTAAPPAKVEVHARLRNQVGPGSPPTCRARIQDPGSKGASTSASRL